MNQDLISRQAAINALGERPMVWVESDYELGARNQYDADVLALETVPSVQPEHLVKESGNLVNGLVNDCISRQAAIEHLKKRLYETALNNVTEHPYYEEMADNRVSVWLKEVPSAQPEQRWIPVTEDALPEDFVAVWVTIRGHDVIRCDGDETLEQAIDRVRKMVRVEGGFYVAYEKTWYNAGGYPMMVQPVAWMPINRPEAYKGGQDE